MTINATKSGAHKTTAAVGLLVVVALGLAFLYLTRSGKLFRVILTEAKKSRQRKVRLLSETDHQALLEACRRLPREFGQRNLTAPGLYKVHRKPAPEVKWFPKVILDIEPMYVDIRTDGSIVVGLGGIHHYGMTAYPENYVKPNKYFKFGDKKIIDGLWYYEDGYNSRHDKWVEKQLQKGKSRQKQNTE